MKKGGIIIEGRRIKKGGIIIDGCTTPLRFKGPVIELMHVCERLREADTTGKMNTVTGIFTIDGKAMSLDEFREYLWKWETAVKELVDRGYLELEPTLPERGGRAPLPEPESIYSWGFTIYPRST